MASFGEEDNILQENSGRRTRSGRSSVPVHPLELPARANRRSRKTVQVNVPEEEPQPNIEVVESGAVETEDSSSIIMEMVAEAAQGVIGGEIIYDKGIYENAEEVIIEESGTIGDEDIEIYSGVDDEQINCELRLPESAGIDEKSSSFPFATAAQSETSEENQNEEERLNPSSEPVESSLLASLAGDNANSLPSEAGNDENDNKKLFGSKVSDKLDSSDSVSEPAIAEDLENGNGTASDATIQNVEISEDELPTSLKPSINDAEEVSDDELPAPKRAELPADSEIISEDELPSAHAEKRSENSIPHVDSSKELSKSSTKNNSNKHKRKHEDKYKSNEDHNKKVEIKKSRSSEQYNPMSPTSESNDSSSAEKKPKIEVSEDKEKRRDKDKEKDKSDEDKEKSQKEEPDKEKNKEKEKEKKRLPDLDRYWKAVTDDPADFTAWTYLLQYVDNETDAEAAREAYDAFLSQYPYCYGYWRKYADYEKRVGIKANCNAVFERGLEAIPLSVDLWIHYLTHVKNTHADDEQYIRSQFKRAVDVCGLEFRSDKLWDAFIKWESDYKRYNQVLMIYDRLLGIPTQGYNSHFHGFQNLIHQHPITNVLSKAELVKLRREINTNVSKRKNKDTDEGSDTEDYKSPSSCKDESEERHIVLKDDGPDETKDYSDLSTLTEEETTLIKTKVISLRRKFYRNTVESITSRWAFEEGIKRPYFHVKPLERCQLKNWKDYLDFEIGKGDLKRILVLFERCLIACALYDEFWLKMIRFLETKMDNPDIPDITRDVFRRACQIHHPNKPSLHLMWAAFEECRNNFDGAAEVLVNIEKKCPNLLQITYRRINLERRRGDLIKCRELYEHYIENAKNKNIAGSLAIKYARFLNKICNDLDGGLQMLQKVLEKDPGNTRVVLQMIDLALQREKVDEDEVVLIMDKFMSRENIDLEQKVLFAQRKVEFLEDFGSTAKGLQDAQRSLQLALSKANELKKKKETPPTPESVTAITNTSQPGYTNTATPSSSSTTNYNYNAANSAYYNQQGATAYQQQSYDNYYNQWQYGSNNYGYGQWSGYGKYY